MNRYLYSLVRCVPNPRTGEFINVGAIAGSEDTSDWDIRHVQNTRRALRLCSAADVSAVFQFMTEVSDAIEMAEQGDSAPLTQSWFESLGSERRNVVQLSEPRPAVANSASEALELIFERMIIDPVAQQHQFTSKQTLLKVLRAVFRSAKVPASALRERPLLFVGEHLHTTLDFAVGTDHAVQLSQAWSFQKGSVEDVSTEVKAWGYALRRLREADGGKLFGNDGQPVDVRSDVEVSVVIAPPQTKQQEEVFEEAEQVFNTVGATFIDYNLAHEVGDQAQLLLSK